MPGTGLPSEPSLTGRQRGVQHIITYTQYNTVQYSKCAPYSGNDSALENQ